MSESGTEKPKGVERIQVQKDENYARESAKICCLHNFTWTLSIFSIKVVLFASQSLGGEIIIFLPFKDIVKLGVLFLFYNSLLCKLIWAIVFTVYASNLWWSNSNFWPGYLAMTSISMTYECFNDIVGIYSWNMSKQCYYWSCEAEAHRDLKTPQNNQQCSSLKLTTARKYEAPLNV